MRENGIYGKTKTFVVNNTKYEYECRTQNPKTINIQMKIGN